MATVLALVPGLLSAQDVSARISSSNAYVGNPIMLRLVISNSSDYDIKLPPTLDGISVRRAGAPSRQSRISIYNGRRTESNTITQDYLVTPEREGKLTIPSFEVMVDGKRRTTKSFELIAEKSLNNGELFVEITGDKERVYVGEPLNIKLKIYVQVYENDQYGVQLDERSTWNLISKNSDLGVFAETFEQMRKNGRRPRGNPVRRTLDSGETATYYVYELEKRIYPNRPGNIDGGDTRIVVNYPTSLRRSRGSLVLGDDDLDDVFNKMFEDSPFDIPRSSRLRVDETRPIVAQAELGSTEVISVPTAGRPANYRGAVGTYEIVTRAEPTKVNAGDPIKLWMIIEGDGPLDLVQPPPLNDLSEASFRVSDQPLAGYVEDGVKYFRTEIRPTRADVDTIPSIPFSFFDPDSEEFKTVYSDPISIQVAEVERLDLNSIVSSKPNDSKSENDSSGNGLTIETELVTPAVPRSGSDTLSAFWWASLIVPPTIWFCILLFNFARATGSLGRRNFSLPKVLQNIDAATSPEEIASQLTDYVGRRFKTSPATLVEAIGALRLHRLLNTAQKYDEFGAQLEKAQLIFTPEQVSGFRKRATELIQLTESEAIEKSHRDKSRVKTSVQTALVFLLATTLPSGLVQAENAELSRRQQEQIFAEANSIYLAAESMDAEEAKSEFEKAANTYDYLIRSGMASPELYFNQGLAECKAENFGMALLRLEQGSLLSADSFKFRKAIRECQLARDESNQAAAIEAYDSNVWWKHLSQLTTGVIGQTNIAWLCPIFLGIFWLILILRTTGYSTISYWFSAPALIAGLVAGGLTFATIQQQSYRAEIAIVVVDSMELRGGDGKQYAALKQMENVDGAYVKLIDHRGKWSKIQTRDLTGWVPSAHLGTIVSDAN